MMHVSDVRFLSLCSLSGLHLMNVKQPVLQELLHGSELWLGNLVIYFPCLNFLFASNAALLMGKQSGQMNGCSCCEGRFVRSGRTLNSNLWQMSAGWGFSRFRVSSVWILFGAWASRIGFSIFWLKLASRLGSKECSFTSTLSSNGIKWLIALILWTVFRFLLLWFKWIDWKCIVLRLWSLVCCL